MRCEPPAKAVDPSARYIRYIVGENILCHGNMRVLHGAHGG